MSDMNLKSMTEGEPMKDRMDKNEEKLLKRIGESTRISIEVTYYRGRSYGRSELRAALKLVKRGILAYVNSVSDTSMIQEARCFGRLGGSNQSRSFIYTFEVKK